MIDKLSFLMCIIWYSNLCDDSSIK